MTFLENCEDVFILKKNSAVHNIGIFDNQEILILSSFQKKPISEEMPLHQNKN